MFVLSPDTIAALHRLVAILLALVDALARGPEGSPRPLASRLALRILSAHLKRLAARYADLADAAPETAPTPPLSEPAPEPAPAARTPGGALPPPIATPAGNLPMRENDAWGLGLCHAYFVTLS